MTLDFQDPTAEQRVQEHVEKLLERDKEEGFDQFTRTLAAFMNRRVIRDWSPREQLALYLENPPIGPDGMPPPDQVAVPEQPDPVTGQVIPARPGVYPQWTALAREFPAEYQWHVELFIKLTGEAMEESG